MTKEAAIEVVNETTTIQRAADEMSVEQIVDRVRKVHDVQRQVMKEGTHYGLIPGVNKPSLLKPGAEILGMVFRLDAQFSLDEQRDGDHLTAVVTCTLYHSPTGARLGSGMGSCSTRESKYAWRKGARKCPACGKEETIIKGKAEYGGGWLCFAKKGGCGQKFADGDPAIEGQVVGRVPNPDLYDSHNTVLKVAIKRAHVAAILFVTCASEIFTQDVEDVADESREPAKLAFDISGLLEGYEAAKTYSQLEQVDSIIQANDSVITEDQKKKLRGVRTRAKKRITDAEERALEEDAERAIA